MRVVLSRSWWWITAVLPAVAGCASVGRRAESPAERYLRVRDSIDAVVAAQATETAPGIRIFVRPNYAQLSSYVDVDFRTDDDAYALVLALDYDDHVRVLYPEAPTAAALVSAGTTPELRSFFAGFGQIMGDPRYRFLRGGVVVALASARPLQLERITTSRGGWDETAIARLLDRTTVAEGAAELGRALTLIGQDFSYDYSTFNTRAARTAALVSRNSVFAECSGGAATYFAALPDPNGFDAISTPLVRYVQVGGVMYAQYLLGARGCAGVYSAPVPIGPRITPTPPTPPDTTVRDTTRATATTLRLREGPRVTPERPSDDGVFRNGDASDVRRASDASTFHRPIANPDREAGWSARERATRESGAPSRVSNGRTDAPPARPVQHETRPVERGGGSPAPIHLAPASRPAPAHASESRPVHQQ